ncbi:MAG: hypothetical protein WBP41_11360 [Saprospiraceae bacterium]
MNELKDSIEEFRNMLSHSRGSILQEQIACEQLIEMILTKYYSSGDSIKDERIYDDLLSNLAFGRKCQLLCKVLMEFGKEKKKVNLIAKELNKIREIRNSVAPQQWHTAGKGFIIFGKKQKRLEVDKHFAEKFKKQVQKVEAPLLAFFIEEMNPNEKIKPKSRPITSTPM